MANSGHFAMGNWGMENLGYLTMENLGHNSMENLVTLSWEVNEALNTRSWTLMLTMILNNVHVYVCTVPGPEIAC